VSKRSWKRLESHFATKPGVAGSKDFAHSACAERRDNLVHSQPGARLERHEWGDYIGVAGPELETY
jgi:hypothetical protein